MERKKERKEFEISLSEALMPFLALVGLLAYNVFIFKDDAVNGSNQFVLLIGASIAAIIGFFNGVSYKAMVDDVSKNIKSTTEAILILLFVGALTGSWLVSGVIPTLIYGGLNLLSPSVFLPLTVIICSIISLSTGSSWTTTATVGIALVTVGKSIGFPGGMVAGAVISGAYFGDKLSPLSDTTNLAPAMAGGELFSHIKYLSYTTIPTYIITLVVFTILGMNHEVPNVNSVYSKMESIKMAFEINAWLLIAPLIVIVLIGLKTKPLVALMIGTIAGGFLSIIFQPDILLTLTKEHSLSFNTAYKAIMTAITTEIKVVTNDDELNKLFITEGMEGMLGTVWLIICAMVFGGVMEAIGALKKISYTILSLAKSVFGLFASTVATCLAVNLTASDQYLSIVVSGKMYSKAYKDRGLAPENLSRTLEDAGTVTSVLIPWNTCGAYQAKVLGVGVSEYFIYAIFNYISPFMTLIFAAFRIRIKRIVNEN